MAEEQQKKIEEYAKANFGEELQSELKRADKVADLVLAFETNKTGEQLANVHTSQGFQSVWDYKGNEKVRFRLDRKKEQVAHNYDAKTHLFQRVYYAKDLLLDDERELRSAYFSAETAYSTMKMVGTATLFLAYFPLTYRLAATVRPVTLALWTGAYYYGGYKNGLEPLTLWRFQ